MSWDQGPGIALQFKKAWPAMFKDYEAACKRGEVTPGAETDAGPRRAAPPPSH